MICYILIESLAWCNHVYHSFSTQLMTPLSFLYSFSGDALCILILLLLQLLQMCMFLQRLLGKLFSVSFQYLEILGEKKTLFFLKVCYKIFSSVVQVSCGGTHSVALTRDGRIFSVCILNTLSCQCCDKKTDI